MTTIEYYDINAQAYFNDTIAVDMEPLRKTFLECLPTSGAFILDVGCGSGRDSKAFAERGHQVTAIDASREMVRLATEHTGLPVRHLRAQELDYNKDVFDGIWACASLLHVPLVELPIVFEHFATALKPGGILYLSFKFGHGEREKDGRHFTDLSEEKLRELLNRCNGLAIYDTWLSEDQRGDRLGLWLNALAQGTSYEL
ncbi:class I SAM-dependent methyltransferase [Arhodomonas aquaeolei]|uniref:class I SAM-dependent methyltransferase n=1 Tax=Arhodomonas aquaeolei TaxID=2369 RepID=UPI00216A0480|nr:class I SAM-dependent methyltransferase [Arhodomonas aquaeolei]MCS4504289.1 class I SAM-dependent methyltransferase [Arhodomonas aquaeolei]